MGAVGPEARVCPREDGSPLAGAGSCGDVLQRPRWLQLLSSSSPLGRSASYCLTLCGLSPSFLFKLLDYFSLKSEFHQTEEEEWSYGEGGRGSSRCLEELQQPVPCGLVVLRAGGREVRVARRAACSSRALSACCCAFAGQTAASAALCPTTNPPPACPKHSLRLGTSRAAVDACRSFAEIAALDCWPSCSWQTFPVCWAGVSGGSFPTPLPRRRRSGSQVLKRDLARVQL